MNIFNKIIPEVDTMALFRENFSKRYFSLFLTALFAVLGITSGMLPAQEKTEQGQGLRVTVLLYSGRPNPTFVLEDKTSVDKVNELMSAAKPAAKEAEVSQHPILGYNGILIENIHGTVAHFPPSVHIQKGNMKLHDGSKKFLKIDERSELEDFLLKKAIDKKVITEQTLLQIRENKNQ